MPESTTEDVIACLRRTADVLRVAFGDRENRAFDSLPQVFYGTATGEPYGWTPGAPGLTMGPGGAELCEQLAPLMDMLAHLMEVGEGAFVHRIPIYPGYVRQLELAGEIVRGQAPAAVLASLLGENDYRTVKDALDPESLRLHLARADAVNRDRSPPGRIDYPF